MEQINIKSYIVKIIQHKILYIFPATDDLYSIKNCIFLPADDFLKLA